ncbi:hypothetical protein LTS18_005378, partial [Coniosporium uncinatum]
ALYSDWTLARLAKMKQNILMLEESIRLRSGSSGVDIAEISDFADHQIAYLTRTVRQLVPEEDEVAVLQKFGLQTVFNATGVWEKIQQVVPVVAHMTSYSGRDWKPDSPLWADLRQTLEDVKAGRTLEGQKGRFTWTLSRAYNMGDELLRQGLAELFLLWLDHVGLWSMYRQLVTGEP